MLEVGESEMVPKWMLLCMGDRGRRGADWEWNVSSSSCSGEGRVRMEIVGMLVMEGMFCGGTHGYGSKMEAMETESVVASWFCCCLAIVIISVYCSQAVVNKRMVHYCWLVCCLFATCWSPSHRHEFQCFPVLVGRARPEARMTVVDTIVVAGRLAMYLIPAKKYLSKTTVKKDQINILDGKEVISRLSLNYHLDAGHCFRASKSEKASGARARSSESNAVVRNSAGSHNHEQCPTRCQLTRNLPYVVASTSSG